VISNGVIGYKRKPGRSTLEVVYRLKEDIYFCRCFGQSRAYVSIIHKGVR